MKKYLIYTILLLCVNHLAFAQDKIGLSAYGGLVLPRDGLTETQKAGYIGGVAVRIPLSSPYFDLTFGASYTILPGRTETFTAFGSKHEHEFESASLVSFIAGTQFYMNDGRDLYLLPGVTANFDQVEARIGAEIGVGYKISLGSGITTMDIMTKYSFFNIVGKKEGEISTHLVGLLIGISY